jgi:gliding motility-associated-like protein
LFKTGLYITSLSFIFTSQSQNLIFNGDFELYDTCPHTLSFPNERELEHCLGWTYPHFHGTSDYFHVCNNADWPDFHPAGVPSNFIAYQYPRSGSAYTGLYAWSPDPSEQLDYREYIQTTLSTPLKTGQYYQFSMYVSYYGYNYALKNLGAVFSENDFYRPQGVGRIDAKPQIEHTGDYLTDSIGWMRVEGVFMADGTEKYLTIGYFTDSLLVADTLLTSDEEYPKWESYYFIDDVELIEIPMDIPNVITPNNDGVNDHLILPIPIDRLSIFNRWGQQVFLSENEMFLWEGVDQKTGKKLEEGVYFYVFEYGTIKKAGFVHLLR